MKDSKFLQLRETPFFHFSSSLIQQSFLIDNVLVALRLFFFE